MRTLPRLMYLDGFMLLDAGGYSRATNDVATIAPPTPLTFGAPLSLQLLLIHAPNTSLFGDPVRQQFGKVVRPVQPLSSSSLVQEVF